MYFCTSVNFVILKIYNIVFRSWNLLRCYLCGQSAVHVKCLGNHYIPGVGYVCNDCNQVVKISKKAVDIKQFNTESRLREHKRMLQELKSRDDPVLLSSSVHAIPILRRKFNVKPCKVLVDPMGELIYNRQSRRLIKYPYFVEKKQGFDEERQILRKQRRREHYFKQKRSMPFLTKKLHRKKKKTYGSKNTSTLKEISKCVGKDSANSRGLEEVQIVSEDSGCYPEDEIELSNNAEACDELQMKFQEGDLGEDTNSSSTLFMSLVPENHEHDIKSTSSVFRNNFQSNEMLEISILKDITSKENIQNKIVQHEVFDDSVPKINQQSRNILTVNSCQNNSGSSKLILP